MFQDIDAKLKCATPGWIGSLAARGPFWQFLVIARLTIWLSINSSGKIRKHVKNCFQSTVSASRACVVTGFCSKFRGQVRTLGLLPAPLGLLGAPGFTSDGY